MGPKVRGLEGAKFLRRSGGYSDVVSAVTELLATNDPLGIQNSRKWDDLY